MQTYLTSIILATVLAFAGTAVAQEYQSPPPPAAAQADVSDKKLKKFSKAHNKVETIREDYTSRLVETQDSEKAQELQTEANMKMTRAVEDAGLDVESFNQIAIALQENPELQQRLSEISD